MAAAGALSQVLRGRMFRAEHLLAALQGVLAQGARRFGLAQLRESAGEGAGRQQGDRVVRAEYPAAALQRVLT
jgi:hypothetical protein